MIRVNDDYIIEIDSFNYTVKRDLHRMANRTDPLTGAIITVPAFSTVGYFGNLSGAVKGVIDDMNRKALSDGVHDLQKALKIVLDNNKRLSELLEKVLEV